ncbi:MAG: hypothetical protein ABEJ78_04430 [Haloferacaceae archaeon]
MRLADDRRARIPFALVGVLLLLGATGFSATLSTRGPMRTNQAVDTAMQRVSADVAPALRSAVIDAARSAALEPVTTPADTPAGQILDPSRPFRDALRIRIYLAARERLRTIQYRHRDVTATASLPDTPDAHSLDEAIRRVRIRGVENGTVLRVTIRNVTVAAHRDGEAIVAESTTRTLTVATPVLALHDRATRFERRLNRGPLAGPGFGRRLTARLYPVVWARAYAQYGGAPVANVLANRHVEVSANGAVLETQRAAFGRSDPDGRRGIKRAMYHLAAKDLLAPAGVHGNQWSRRVLPRPNARRKVGETGAAIQQFDVAESAPTPNRTFEVSVGRTSDRTLSEFLTGERGANLSTVLKRAYRVNASLRTATRHTHVEAKPRPESPGDEWSLNDVTVTTDVATSPTDGPSPKLRPDDHVFSTFGQQVAVNRTIRWRWKEGNSSRTTSGTWTNRYRVGVAVVGQYAPNASAPNATTSPKFRRGGPLDGPNLADTGEKARTLLVAKQGGRDDVAAALVADTLNRTSGVVHGTRPRHLRRWAYADVATLRDTVRNVSTNVSAGDAATMQANPAATLAARLRDRRSELLAAPHRYDGVATRARIAARAAYLDRTIRALDRRAAVARRTTDAFDAALGDRGFTSPDHLHGILDSRSDTDSGRRRSRVGGGGPAGGVRIVPDGDPAYLTLSSVDHDLVSAVPPTGSYHPMTARNVNLFTVPYGDAADTAAKAAFDRPNSVRLRTAGRALVTVDRTLAARDDEELRQRRDDLSDAIRAALRTVRRRSAVVLARETDLSRPERERVVRTAFERWDHPGRRALAASNGSLAADVATVAADRSDALGPVDTDRLETRLRIEMGRAAQSDAAAVSQSVTNRTAARGRQLARRTLTRALTARAANATQATKDRWVGDALGTVPAGLPVAPVPGYWYATVNVWTVRVRGAYARFTLHTDRGTPTTPGDLRYVRDGSHVTLDVDGDGDEERLGRDERISFRTRTAVAVAVPPKGNGVGDVDGNRDERSGGWPRPACTSWNPRECPSE